jgi:hypothetical protein
VVILTTFFCLRPLYQNEGVNIDSYLPLQTILPTTDSPEIIDVIATSSHVILKGGSNRLRLNNGDTCSMSSLSLESFAKCAEKGNCTLALALHVVDRRLRRSLSASVAPISNDQTMSCPIVESAA